MFNEAETSYEIRSHGSDVILGARKAGDRESQSKASVLA